MSDLDVERRSRIDDDVFDRPNTDDRAPAVQLPRIKVPARTRRHRSRNRSPRLSAVRNQLVTVANHRSGPEGIAMRQDRIRRLRVLAASSVGVLCLLVAQVLYPDTGDGLITSLRAFPTDLTGWLSLLCGVVGVWLVPGLWLSAFVARLGAGLTAWLATRIATTLVWYTLISPAIHQLGRGARITTPGLLIATIGATAAVGLGIALGMSRWPSRRWQRILLPAALGAVLAQSAIWVWTTTWVYGMNYEHIRRLDWLIVLACAALVTIGTVNRPAMPPMRTVRNSSMIVVALAVVAATVFAAAFANTRWSPEQRMPSAFSVEQEQSPPFGVTVAFLLTPIGPGGSALISEAEWAAFDDAGLLVPAHMQMAITPGADTAQLYVVLVPGTQPLLCRPGRPSKLSVRDLKSGVNVQALIPQGWCGP